MSSVNRKLARSTLAAFLTTVLTPDPVVGVFDYPTSLKQLDGIYPIVRMQSLSSERTRKFLGQNLFAASFDIGAEILVRQADTGFTESDAEDKLDDIEALIADALSDQANIHAGGFDLLEYGQPTEVLTVEMDDGIVYRREVIPLRIRLLHG